MLKSLWESSKGLLNDDLLVVYYFTVCNRRLEESGILNKGHDLYPSILLLTFHASVSNFTKLIIAFCMSLCGCVVSTAIILVLLLCIPKCIA